MFKFLKKNNSTQIRQVKKTPNYLGKLFWTMFSIIIIIGSLRGLTSSNNAHIADLKKEERFVQMFITYSLSDDTEKRTIAKSYLYDNLNSFEFIYEDSEAITVSVLSRTKINDDINYVLYLRPYNITATLTIKESENSYIVTRNLMATDFPSFTENDDKLEPREIKTEMITAEKEDELLDLIELFFENYNNDREKLNKTTSFELFKTGPGYFQIDSIKVIGQLSQSDNYLIKINFVSNDTLIFAKQYVFEIDNKEIKNIKEE